MRRTISIVCLLVLSLCAWSVPASPEPILRELSDGSIDTVYLHGDEFCHYYTDAQGKMLSGSPYIDSAWTESMVRRSPQRTMIGGYVPQQGKVRVPVLLVNFTDLSFSMANPKTQFSDFYNGNGGTNPHATGSVHSYYTASSNGKLDLEYEVWGPFNLSNDMAYYGENKKNGEVVTNHNIRIAELVKEAVQLAYDNGVDFSRYDANNDGNIDNVSIVVAGHNEAEGAGEETIWPHYSVINNSKTYSGKYISGYLVISEYRSNKGKTQAGIGTYCHEFGHALGLPDLYDTHTSDRYTVGKWDVMCTGCYNNSGSTPPSFTAFERFAMGWLTPEQIQTAGEHTLAPIERDNTAYLVASGTHNRNAMAPSPSEYFLIENRQRTGWDAGNEALVAPGLMVSHITFDAAAWKNNTFNNGSILGYCLVSPRSETQTQSSIADVFPGSTRCTSWTPTLNNGTRLDAIAFSQIRPHDDGTVSWLTGSAGEDRLLFLPDEVTATTPFLSEPVRYDTVMTTLRIPAMAQDTIRLYGELDYFRISTDNGNSWNKRRDTVRIAVPADSSFNVPILVVHTPSRQSCTNQYAFLTAEAKDPRFFAQATLVGNSERPVLITTPVIDSVNYLSSKTFCVNWEAQSDADYYYYELYTIENGEKHYIYSLEEHFIYGSGTSIVFRDLEPSTTYYYAMQACEEKGCTPHYSALTEPISVRTLDNPEEMKLVIVRHATGQYSLVLPEMADGVHYVDIFDYTGHRYCHAKIPFGTTSYALPALPTGQVYLVKYYTDKFTRKDLHTKLMSY